MGERGRGSESRVVCKISKEIWNPFGTELRVLYSYDN